MRFGLSLPCFGDGVDAAVLAETAVAAERAGWDGFFLRDHLLAFGPGPSPVVDPWISLTAAACATSTTRFGTLLTPLPRRRPVVVARQTATLDHLSGGRVTLGVGSGAFPFEWEFVGEEGDASRPVCRPTASSGRGIEATGSEAEPVDAVVEPGAVCAPARETTEPVVPQPAG